MYVYMHMFFVFCCLVPARTPPDPQNRREMAGTGGPGPPTNNPTVKPRIKNTKYRPKDRHAKWSSGASPAKAWPSDENSRRPLPWPSGSAFLSFAIAFPAYAKYNG